MTGTTLTPSRVWKQMTPDQRQRAARAFWSDEDAADDQIKAVMLIAQQKKFRPKTVIGLELDRKARHLASLALLPDTLAARALVVYHLAEHRPMMAAFLDALGIAHENGLIKEDEVRAVRREFELPDRATFERLGWGQCRRGDGDEAGCDQQRGQRQEHLLHSWCELT